jgi:hypothetical protein
MITAKEYRDGLRMAAIMAGAVRTIDFPAMLAAIAHAEAMAPIVDPSLLQARGLAMSEDKTLIGIFARAKRELDALPWPELTEATNRAELPGVPFSVERAADNQQADGQSDGDASRVLSGQGAR